MHQRVLRFVLSPSSDLEKIATTLSISVNAKVSNRSPSLVGPKNNTCSGTT